MVIEMSARQFLKRLVFAACLVVVSPMILAAWIEEKVSRGETVFVFLSQPLALFLGLVAAYLIGEY